MFGSGETYEIVNTVVHTQSHGNTGYHGSEKIQRYVEIAHGSEVEKQAEEYGYKPEKSEHQRTKGDDNDEEHNDNAEQNTDEL